MYAVANASIGFPEKLQIKMILSSPGAREMAACGLQMIIAHARSGGRTRESNHDLQPGRARTEAMPSRYLGYDGKDGIPGKADIQQPAV